VEEERRALALSCWAGSAVGWASSWAVREKGGKGEKESRPRGGGAKEDWAEPKSSEGESLSLFIFRFSFLLNTNLFQNIFKPNLNSFSIFIQNHSSQ